MLVIRLTRKGKKNQPFFRVVVVDKRRSAKGSRAVEILGHIDPLTKRKSLKKERILHWLKNGAKPSDTVHNLLISEKIIEAKKISKHNKSKNQKTEELKSQKTEPAPIAIKTPVSAEPSAVPAEKLAENSKDSTLPAPSQEKTEKPAEPEKSS